MIRGRGVTRQVAICRGRPASAASATPLWASNSQRGARRCRINASEVLPSHTDSEPRGHRGVTRRTGTARGRRRWAASEMLVWAGKSCGAPPTGCGCYFRASRDKMGRASRAVGELLARSGVDRSGHMVRARRVPVRRVTRPQRATRRSPELAPRARRGAKKARL